MTDLMIIILLFIFAAAFFMAGYLMGKKDIDKDGWIKIKKREGNTLALDEPLIQTTPVNAEIVSKYIDEPSGPIYRPTAKELAKMNEDEATKQAKEALKETFDNAGEPKI